MEGHITTMENLYLLGTATMKWQLLTDFFCVYYFTDKNQFP